MSGCLTLWPSRSATAGATGASTALANLIVNGGFEDNAVASGNWAFFASSNVNGWEGSNIEIWDNYGGVSAAEGSSTPS